jgi:leader peptidase (prepilin peptidase)/N-methyltransferase
MPAGLAYVFLPAAWPHGWHSVGEALLGALVPSLTLWLVGELYFRIRKREGLGLGDVKMVAMIGAFLGLSAGVLALIAGSMLGAVTGLLFILITRKDAATYELPFGTFLGATALYIAHFGAAWPAYPRLPGG